MQAGQPAWSPANSVEWELWRCLDVEDNAGFLRVLGLADLFLPGFRRAGPPEDDQVRQRLLTIQRDDRTYLSVFTSPEGLDLAAGDVADGWHLTSLAELDGKWPDQRWGLAVNPGLPVGALLERDQVSAIGAALAAMPPFHPDGPAEEALHAAVRSADPGMYVATLTATTVLVARDKAGESNHRLGHDDLGPYLLAFTSEQRLVEGGGDPVTARSVGFATLAQNWPDPGCRLVVNRGSMIELIIDGAWVSRLPVMVTAATESPQDSLDHSLLRPTSNGSAGSVGEPAATAAGPIEVTVDELTVRRYLDLGDGRVSGRVAAAGASTSDGYRVRWREPDPVGGIVPGNDVRDLPLPSGARLVRTGGSGETVVATYHTGPDRWIKAGAKPKEPVGP